VRVLIVEDEAGLREGIRDLMMGDGHEVTAVADGLSAVELGTREAFDIVLLDLMLPKLDGIEVCRRLRAARPGLAILMLTSRGSENDKVTGLGEGADDYVTKPFAARELLARVRALGRRHLGTPDAETWSRGSLSLDFGQLQGALAGSEFSLSPKEAGILRMLMRCHPNAVSRADLLESVWGSRGDLETRAVDMAIATLRKKIETTPAKPALLMTVKGIGYRWGEAP
jgi:two-component system alkaline phosphatase synthesis response regulator PhoP